VLFSGVMWEACSAGVLLPGANGVSADRWWVLGQQVLLQIPFSFCFCLGWRFLEVGLCLEVWGWVLGTVQALYFTAPIYSAIYSVLFCLEAWELLFCLHCKENSAFAFLFLLGSGGATAIHGEFCWSFLGLFV